MKDISYEDATHGLSETCCNTTKHHLSSHLYVTPKPTTTLPGSSPQDLPPRPTVQTSLQLRSHMQLSYVAQQQHAFTILQNIHLLASTNINRLNSLVAGSLSTRHAKTYIGVLRRATPGMETACQRDLLSGSRGWRIGNGSGINAVEARCRLAGCGLQGACCMAVSRVGLGLGDVVLVRRLLDCGLGVSSWMLILGD